jgi:DNA-directed RNA polymerase subunit RPC12/RpoP
MKRWKWKTNPSAWTPIVECPYCGIRFSPFAIMGSSCVVCGHRVRRPKKDYWETMEEGEAE